MRVILVIMLLVSVSAGPVSRQADPTRPPEPATSQDGVSVYFSPKGNCAEAIVYWVNSVKPQGTLDIAAYSITHVDIAKAIKEAHERGVKVRVIMDRTQAAGRYSSATYLFNAGVPVWIDRTTGLMHNKYAIIDGKTVITGSFNWTKGADNDNAENLVVFEGKDKLAKGFSDDFEKVMKGSKPYEGVKAD